MKRTWLIGMVTVGILVLVLVGWGQQKRTHADRAVAFTAQFEQTTEIGGGRTVLPMTVAVYSNGTVYQEEHFPKGGVIVQVTSIGKRIIAWPDQNMKHTYALPAASFNWAGLKARVASGCVAETRSASRASTFSSMKRVAGLNAAEHVRPGGKNQVMTWEAPALNCFPVFQELSPHDSKGVLRHQVKRLVSYQLGDPPKTLMDALQNVREVSPVERARHFSATAGFKADGNPIEKLQKAQDRYMRGREDIAPSKCATCK